jgi:hypothetical protein
LGVALSLSFFLLSRLSEKEQGSPTTIIVVSTVQFRERNKKPRNTNGYHLLDLWARKTSEEDVRTGTSERFYTECNKILVLAGNALLQAAAPPVS